MTELRVYFMEALGNVPNAIYLASFVILCIGIVTFWCWKGLKGGMCYSALLMLVEWVILVFCTCIIFRDSSAAYRVNLIPLSSYFDYGENSYLMEKTALNILNMALFIPVGLLIGCGLRNMTWRRVLTIGVVLSVSLELLQLVRKKGLCEFDDVVHNGVGCMIGYALYELISKIGKYV